MKPLTFITAVLISILVLSSARGQAPVQPSPPVPAEDWIAISPHLGFVIVEDRNMSPHSFSSGPRVRGYFMAFRQNMWLRLEVAPEMRLYRIEQAR